MKLNFATTNRDKELEDFDPVKIFECGQCFRWRRRRRGYIGLFRNARGACWKKGKSE